VWQRQVAAAVAGKAPSFVPIQIGIESGGRADESERTSSAQARPLKITDLSIKVCGVSSEENPTECCTIL
jgi:transposase